MKSIKNIDKTLFFVTLGLVVIGSIMMFSASNIAAFMRYEESPIAFFGKQLVSIFLGFVIGFFILLTDSKKLYHLSYLAGVVLIGLLVFVLLRNQYINNARSWIPVWKFSMQPSEFVKVAFILWISGYYFEKRHHLKNWLTVLFPIVIALVIAILIFLQPDFGTLVIFGLITLFMFIINPIGRNIKKVIYSLIGLFIIFMAINFIANPQIINKLPKEQRQRLDTHNFCSPERFFDDGNQMCNSLIAFNNGNIKGKGLTNSSQKYLYLSDSHTDFIFPIIVEELGLVGGITIILFYMLLIAKIIIIGRESLNNQNASTCYGIAMYLFLHIFVNIGGVTGLIPMTGVPLPLISYGGSFILTAIIAIFIVQRINIENNLEKLRK